MIARIEANGRTLVIHAGSAGQSFGCIAWCRVGSRRFESDVRPLGSELACVRDVCKLVTDWQKTRKAKPR